MSEKTKTEPRHRLHPSFTLVRHEKKQCRCGFCGRVMTRRRVFRAEKTLWCPDPEKNVENRIQQWREEAEYHEECFRLIDRTTD